MKRIVYYGFLIFVVCICIGYVYARIWDNLNNNSEVAIENEIVLNNTNSNSNTEIVETVGTEEKLSPNASLAFKKYYDECSHFDFQYAELPVELVNLTKEEVQAMYKDWKVEEFSKDSLVLGKEINSICDEHYFIKLGEKHIEIYNLGKDEELTLYKETDIPREYLTDEDIETLEEGVYVFGKGKLNSAIEDFE